MRCIICGANHITCGTPYINRFNVPVGALGKAKDMALMTSARARGNAAPSEDMDNEELTEHEQIQARLAEEKRALRESEPVVGRLKRLSDGALFRYDNKEGDKLVEAGTHEWVYRGRDVEQTAETRQPITGQEPAKATRSDKPESSGRMRRRANRTEEKGVTKAPENKMRSGPATDSDNVSHSETGDEDKQEQNPVETK
jgi:hypothetical protein